ncbi:hypothetical protein PF005_g18453 [Phytophthora fragariae]|uniref:Uncharacterized protein n=1 Tax=Phytophthora fragariae TaxID=53985 RepID=A0A6A3X5G2_9STRA|nr:hypothetical protein PF003_g32050 [Phytophthora fragariae]KAE9008025.1 hypothetical protein PF011_g10871 [Phytophthora fragariae]KAE9085456.1 hypothetical protein PF007_g21138 [Phytophthora fragariae]KAE9192454.1 hypothetical protein PF005_g18453 [Phytophthora fragariae]KAE9199193.1 hypothetical protein PF002_g22219 [Phytophthora fragariae]
MKAGGASIILTSATCSRSTSPTEGSERPFSFGEIGMYALLSRSCKAFSSGEGSTSFTMPAGKMFGPGSAVSPQS